MQTELTLSLGGLPPLSARGCIQDLRPVAQGAFRRTINGDLLFVGVDRQHKYRSTIRCSDQAPLATMPVGAEVMVGCVQQLCQKIPAHKSEICVPLERCPRPGSILIVDDRRHRFSAFNVEITQPEEPRSEATQNPKETVLRLAPFPHDLYVFYHPLLRMRLTSFTLTTDEWNNKAGWTLEFEEI